MTDLLTFIITAFASFSALSFLYRENPLSRISESLLIGSTIGYYAVLALNTIFKHTLTPIMQGNVIYIIPLILGFLTYGVLSKNYVWLTRYPLSLMIGTQMAIFIKGTVKAQLLEQFFATTNLLNLNQTPFEIVTNLVFIIGTYSVISYFIFWEKLNVGPVKLLQRLGRLYLLIALGGIFGSTVVSRENVLISRFSQLFAPDVKWISAGIIGVIVVILYLLYKTGYLKDIG